MHGWLTYSLDPSVASSHLHKYGFCFSLILNTFQEKFIKFNLYSMPINLAKASKCDHTVFTVLTFSTQSVSNIHCIFLRLWLEHFCNLVCQEMGEKIFPISLYPFPYSTNHHLHCQFINQSDYLKAKLNQFKEKTLINFEDKIDITVLFIFGFQFVGIMFSRGHTAVSSLGHGWHGWPETNWTNQILRAHDPSEDVHNEGSSLRNSLPRGGRFEVSNDEITSQWSSTSDSRDWLCSRFESESPPHPHLHSM